MATSRIPESSPHTLPADFIAQAVRLEAAIEEDETREWEARISAMDEALDRDEADAATR